MHLLIIIFRCIFEEDSKFYLQLYLDDCFYELRVYETLALVTGMDRIDISEGIGVNKINASKECDICLGFVLSMSHIFAMVVMI